MKNTVTLIIFMLSLAFQLDMNAQSMLSSNFNRAGEGSIVLSYLFKNYDEFWAGEKEMTAPNGGLNQNILSLYARYALTDKLEIVANIPYLSNKSEDETVSDKQLQDISLFLKGQIFELNKFSGGLAVGTNIATGYNPESLYSLGNGATTLDGLVLLHYMFDYGLSLGVQGGYSLRNDEVPDASLFMAKLGYSASFLYVDIGYGAQKSVDGTDIAGPGFSGPADFPKSKVDYQQFFSSVYIPVNDNIGLVGHYGSILNGRNIGKYSYYGMGIAANW